MLPSSKMERPSAGRRTTINLEVLMSNDSVYLPVDLVCQFMMDALVRMGVPPEDAKVTSDILITADLWGVQSHGIGHLKMYHHRIKVGHQRAVTNLEIVKDTPTTAVADGGNGMGQVVGYRMMKLAIEKARRYGLGAVAVRNSSHFGVAGYYAKMAVDEGMVGICVTNARPAAAPTFGVTPLLGTNPIAFAAPTDEPFPFLYDAATTIAARGKVEVLERAEKSTPAGWVINEDGSMATDSAQILQDMKQKKAALLPLGGLGELMGGHKGYGLATSVEILSAAFQSGAFLSGLTDLDAEGKPQPLRIGHFLLAMDVEHFVPLNEYKKTTGDMLRELRASKKIPGTERIYTAGEKEYYNAQRVRTQGLEVTPGLRRDLKALQQELGLTQYNLGS